MIALFINNHGFIQLNAAPHPLSPQGYFLKKSCFILNVISGFIKEASERSQFMEQFY